MAPPTVTPPTIGPGEGEQPRPPAVPGEQPEVLPTEGFLPSTGMGPLEGTLALIGAGLLMAGGLLMLRRRKA